jgi:uncharacterized integral membrane protein
MNVVRWATLLAVVLLTGVFSYLNAGQRITLHLGFTTLYRLSLSHIVLGAFLLGMLTMFLVGLRNDLRLRRDLRGDAAHRPLPPETRAAELDRIA